MNMIDGPKSSSWEALPRYSPSSLTTIFTLHTQDQAKCLLEEEKAAAIVRMNFVLVEPAISQTPSAVLSVVLDHGLRPTYT